jgi:hypothetical protein
MQRSLALAGALVPFLALSLSAGPARGEAGSGSQSTGQAAPTGGPPSSRPHRTGLLIAGSVTLGFSYMFTAMMGLSALDSYSGGTVCDINSGACVGTGNPVGRDLLIPVLGPWLAFRDIGDMRELPLMAFLGIAQATGAALTLAGIVRYSTEGATPEARPSGFISFGVLPTRDGAFGFLSGRM